MAAVLVHMAAQVVADILAVAVVNMLMLALLTAVAVAVDLIMMERIK